MNDLIRLVCEKAAMRFGGTDKVFSAAAFSCEWQPLTGTVQLLDGIHVRAMLTGRPDIKVLAGGCHFKLIEETT